MIYGNQQSNNHVYLVIRRRVIHDFGGLGGTEYGSAVLLK